MICWPVCLASWLNIMHLHDPTPLGQIELSSSDFRLEFADMQLAKISHLASWLANPQRLVNFHSCIYTLSN